MGLESDKPRPNEVERSEMVNEEMVYFIFQMDLDVQLQRALNYEAYEFAQGVRAKRQRVDEALSVMMQRKVQNVSSEAASAAMDSSELAAEGLGLRAKMQQAVEEERYSDAARIRDMLADLERRAKRAEALAAEFKPSRVPRAFRLGQRVKHRKFGYRGLVVGWDAQCCESDEWAEAVGVASLPRGSKQPFYQLLVDVRDWSFDYTLPPVAYVAEDFLWAPEQGGPEGMEALQGAQSRSQDAEGSTAAASSSSSSSSAAGKSQEGPKTGEPMSWVERFGEGPFRHPYEYMLFLGRDARGDYLPCKQLRDRYNVQRRDVWAPGDDGTEDDDGEGDDKPDIFPRI
ncbi:Hemimethylated DNA-binding protein YccV like-domain-containing protein [Dunaliella salina]|uniref:Hemimethylated DNA-binding protein YccV like-domain-containing protein n=1 Tax=Dunaliella salina TaxID=3046 RepID=A0ABQ7G030_DUNSA|nr:Hemimethylated DNA-binding protein YccV like-domain-containing protein [Dunaliella salina]|eukprot:KAF5827961.1 Hemimethylated DNA-binding protein YccV like-domain-containing protein [Dunaliella salina]